MSLLTHYGYGVVFLVVFLNNAGVPVPGDTMLLGAGFLAAKGIFSLWISLLAGTAGCFLGCDGGYWLGRRFGHKILNRFTWLHFTPKKDKQVEEFFKKHGTKAVFFARFVVLLHPVTGLFAGMWKMPLRPFLFYNLIGSMGCAFLYILGGYYFGQNWELLRHWIGHTGLYVILIGIILVLLSLLVRHSVFAFFARITSKKG